MPFSRKNLVVARIDVKNRIRNAYPVNKGKTYLRLIGLKLDSPKIY